MALALGIFLSICGGVSGFGRMLQEDSGFAQSPVTAECWQKCMKEFEGIGEDGQKMSEMLQRTPITPITEIVKGSAAYINASMGLFCKHSEVVQCILANAEACGAPSARRLQPKKAYAIPPPRQVNRLFLKFFGRLRKTQKTVDARADEARQLMERMLAGDSVNTTTQQTQTTTFAPSTTEQGCNSSAMTKCENLLDSMLMLTQNNEVFSYSKTMSSNWTAGICAIYSEHLKCMGRARCCAQVMMPMNLNELPYVCQMAQIEVPACDAPPPGCSDKDYNVCMEKITYVQEMVGTDDVTQMPVSDQQNVCAAGVEANDCLKEAMCCERMGEQWDPATYPFIYPLGEVCPPLGYTWACSETKDCPGMRSQCGDLGLGLTEAGTLIVASSQDGISMANLTAFCEVAHLLDDCATRHDCCDGAGALLNEDAETLLKMCGYYTRFKCDEGHHETPPSQCEQTDLTTMCMPMVNNVAMFIPNGHANASSEMQMEACHLAMGADACLTRHGCCMESDQFPAAVLDLPEGCQRMNIGFKCAEQGGGYGGGNGGYGGSGGGDGCDMQAFIKCSMQYSEVSTDGLDNATLCQMSAGLQQCIRDSGCCPTFGVQPNSEAAGNFSEALIMCQQEHNVTLPECWAEASCPCDSAELGNGICDTRCNTEDCAWDYGDCADQGPFKPKEFIPIDCDRCRVTGWTMQDLCFSTNALQACESAAMSNNAFAFSMGKGMVCQEGEWLCSLYTDDAVLNSVDVDCGRYALAKEQCTIQMDQGTFYLKYSLLPFVLPSIAGTIPQEIMEPWSAWTTLYNVMSVYGIAEQAECFCSACPTSFQHVVNFVMRPGLLLMMQSDSEYPVKQEEIDHMTMSAACPMVGAESCLVQSSSCSSLTTFLEQYKAQYTTPVVLQNPAETCTQAGYPIDGSMPKLECDAGVMPCRAPYMPACPVDGKCTEGSCGEDASLCATAQADPFGQPIFGSAELRCVPKSDGCPCMPDEVKCGAFETSYCVKPNMMGNACDAKCEGADDGSAFDECLPEYLLQTPEDQINFQDPTVCQDVLGVPECMAKKHCCGLIMSYEEIFEACKVVLQSDAQFVCEGYTSWGSGGTGGDMVHCTDNEVYCQDTVYGSDGVPNWDATHQGQGYCKPQEEGCPCNQQWEVSCDSQGYKYCEPKENGCPSLFDVTCDEATEVVCKDEFYAYCWVKDWGNCPVYCNSTQTYCSRRVFDSNGEVDWSQNGEEFCAPVETGCPCDSQYEHKCTDEWGNSWCNLKVDPCPLVCKDGEQDCYSVQYRTDGEPNWELPFQQSCQSETTMCPCNDVFEYSCQDLYSSWCQPKVYGNCPVFCGADEITCWVAPYTEDGENDWTAQWSEVCAPASEGCPCNEMWEQQCTEFGQKFCIPKSDQCPLDCGEMGHCWHFDGVETCMTESGCVCKDDELSCTNPDTQKTECMPKAYYTDCPVQCAENEIICGTVGFDENGWTTWTDYCHAGQECPVSCDSTTAKQCPGEDWCMATSDTCPVVCTESQTYCWVDNFGTDYSWTGSTETCVDAGQPCPCGTGMSRCSDPFTQESWCEHDQFGCPVICDPVKQKSCWPLSYTVEGEPDWDAPVQQSCVNASKPCPCGANAKMCRWVDEYGQQEEFCEPTGVTCPVTCSSDERICYTQDYNASGYPLAERQVCTKRNQPCNCGSHAQRCHDPWADDYFCFPLWDFQWNSAMRCPVWCTAQQEYCYVDSYDAKGNWLSVEETCVNPGETCDCTKGQNAFSCTMTDGVSTWSECLPINGGYCPPSCAANEVPCFEVENFRPNGTSIGFTEPPKPCAADYESCSCGREAKNCGGWCIFKEDNCPVFCEVGKKKCFIDDYDTSGNYLGDREVCVAEDQVCPCGKNTLRCPGDDMCLRKSEADLVCPCSESQKQCTVRDYTARGKLESVSTLCVNLGNKCPCGKNTLSCSDPNDPDDNICNPKYAGTVLNKCPKPCTPTEEAAGNKTCIQTHLTNTGTFESETISCLPAASCTPGRNMKKCTSGSTIPAWKPCKDFYNTAKSNSSAVGAGKKESSQVILTFESLSNGALGSSEDVRVMMNAEVYLPTGCESSLDIKTSKSNRRLKGRKLQTTGGAVLKFTVSNQGATSVSPTAVAEQLKQQVKRQSPGMKTALTQLGTVDEKAAVAMSSQTTTVRTRAAAVQEKNLAALGVTTTTTTTTTQSTTTGATTAAPATTTTAAGPTTTTMGTTTVADSTTERTISSATCRHFALLPLLAAYLSFAR